MPPRKATAATAAAKKKGPSYASSMQALYFKHLADARAKYGGKTVVLMQVGSFFEMYDVLTVSTGIWEANVQTIAELCGSSVQPKPTGDPDRQTFFWGFPEAALEKYEPMITAAGYSVVVIIQKKDATGEVSERLLSHVSSPGCAERLSAAVRKEEQIMLCVYVEPWVAKAGGAAHWYLASTAFDITTGRCVSMETDITLIDGKPVLDIVTPFWSVYPPVEVCFYWSADSAPPSEAAVSGMFAAAGQRPPLIHIYPLDPKTEGAAPTDRIRSAFLAETFHHDSALSVEEHLDVTRYNFARRALYHLLQFVRDHNPSFLTLLHEHTIWTPEDNVLLGNSALEQLGMLPLSVERTEESLLAWLQKATTAMGRRTLRERILKPIADVAELSERQDRIAEFRSDPATCAALTAELRGMYDLARIHRRFQLGNGTCDDLLQLLASYSRAEQILKITSGKLYDAEDAPALQTHLRSILDRWDEERVRAARAQVSDAVAVGSNHPWRRGIHADLDAAEDAWLAEESAMRKFCTNMEEVLEENDVIKWELRDDAPFTFTTTQRRSTTLAAVSKKRLKTEITATKRGASVFQLDCPEISAANAAGRIVRANMKALAAEAWKADWSAWCRVAIDNNMLNTLVEWIGTLDAEVTLARVSDLYGYVRPNYVESSEKMAAGFSVKDLRHPIIERVHTSAPYIPHSLRYGAFASAAAEATEEGADAPLGILLYGVNAAGKSSLGKAIGLAVLMAQTGMPVPATEMTLIPYTGIFTRILGNDNLWAGMSSFVVEMTEFRSILRSAGPRTLVIGDELCAGTETASASAIVAAGVKTLADRGTNFFFATHLHELADIPEIADRREIRAYHLTVRPSATQHGALVYDRKLRAGTGSPMYGLEVCRGLDMDPTFLAAAFDFRRRYYGDGEAKQSRYNATVVVRACEVCGARGAGLETHHIVPQAAADAKGRLAPGKHKNDKSNLTVLCDDCHKAHHSGLLEVQGWIETTAGRRLEYKWL